MYRLCFALLLAASLATPITHAAGARADKPNVLIVITDDQGMGDFSYTGNPVLKTPGLDRFAAEAVRFTDFHVTPMCTPTRGQLLTGVDALRNGATTPTGRTTAASRRRRITSDSACATPRRSSTTRSLTAATSTTAGPNGSPATAPTCGSIAPPRG
jgi:hypothetical protein